MTAMTPFQADQRDGRYPPKDEWQLRRQCPSCMHTAAPAHSLCQSCGLKFFEPVTTEEQSLRNIYIGIGAGAFLLATFIGTALVCL